MRWKDIRADPVKTTYAALFFSVLLGVGLWGADALIAGWRPVHVFGIIAAVASPVLTWLQQPPAEAVESRRRLATATGERRRGGV